MTRMRIKHILAMENNDRFILQPSREKGSWVATDKKNGIVITFKEHDFNGSQKVTLLGGDTLNSMEQAMALPTALRELADWLRAEHYDITMPSLTVQREEMGRMIRNIRTQRGMTQMDVAEAAGIGQSHLARIEAGRYAVSLDVLNKIAYALGVRLEMK